VARSWANPAVTFRFLVLALELDFYFHSIISGFVISVGGLSEAVVKESSAALLKWCRSKKLSKNFRQLEMLASSFITLFEAHTHDDRVTIPLLKTVDMLLKNDILYFLTVKQHSFAARLLQCVRTEVNKTNDVGKTRLCIELLVLLLAFDDPVRPAALRSIVMLVGHKYPKVRKHASDLLYLQLISDSVSVGPTPSEVEVRALSGDPHASSCKCGLASSVENLDRASEILMTTAWDSGDLMTARACREELATALGLSIASSLPREAAVKVETGDELNSYSSLVRDAGY
jgi:hypothetical protein